MNGVFKTNRSRRRERRGREKEVFISYLGLLYLGLIFFQQALDKLFLAASNSGS
ncbi:MAG: hypothetical protein RLZZ507_198 [Cyanobacteriota bacterium]|jgi:hypothetical protein